MNKHCVICGAPLDDSNRSSEHIIQNAIGGILEDSGIYCKNCNSKFGRDLDKKFTSIFSFFVDRLDIKKSRKSKGSPYTGIMFDIKGNRYRVTWKNKKVLNIKHDDGTYIDNKIPNNIQIKSAFCDFTLDNNVFKCGLSKIAFNYAVHCGVDVADMEKLFDIENKCTVSKPVILPFVPMTPFDAIMESYQVDKLFHALRIFNLGNFLFVYIELFSTFQFYVLLSEKFNKEIDICYCNYIEKIDNGTDSDLLKVLTPSDYKDADIIMKQYGISSEEVKGEVEKNYSNKSCVNCEQAQFETIGKIALRELHKKNNTNDYNEVVNNLHGSIDFVFMFNSILKGFSLEGSSAEKDTDVFRNASDFMNSFKFYTDCEGNYVDIHKYKRYLPDGRGYPLLINEMLQNGEDISAYSYSKFRMLEQRLFKN